MNRQQHLTIGVIAFLAYTYLIYLAIKISSDAIVYALISAVLGSIIPDILEAPTSWMHRGLGHSKRALKLTGKILVITALVGLLFSIFYIISSFFLGYVFHLLADATTEVGLPD
ncbi:MAG: metal-dependent hydrolase [Candidatus Methanoperedens sp.]|nr:metal-dependent hydrolase [Candidatus Methanoperedens sp.]MCZ7395216.1 metal-dependent hydrolase [Candidatus Methanoperedens sp.]